MGDSLCDMFLKEHEKYLPVQGMIQDSYGKPKTPYQLDLEVSDRKPSIIPKVGDRVKIKSREWYEKWKNPCGNVDVLFSFVEDMSIFCGSILEVEKGTKYGLSLKGVDYTWSLEMFEEVYPVQEQLSSKFPKIDLNSPCLYQSPYEVKGSDVIAVKSSNFIAKVEETTKRLAAYSLVQGLTAKPKLKQIKTTHLIKLKKL